MLPFIAWLTAQTFVSHGILRHGYAALCEVVSWVIHRTATQTTAVCCTQACIAMVTKGTLLTIATLGVVSAVL